MPSNLLKSKIWTLRLVILVSFENPSEARFDDRLTAPLWKDGSKPNKDGRRDRSYEEFSQRWPRANVA